MRVSELVKRDIITLHRHDSLDRLMQVLGESPQDIFPVVDEQGKVVGTVSELDLIGVLHPTQRPFPFGPRQLVREGLVRDLEDVMTPRPSTTRLNDEIDAALHRMASLSLPQLVVVDEEGRLIGLLRGRDVYQALHRRR